MMRLASLLPVAAAAAIGVLVVVVVEGGAGVAGAAMRAAATAPVRARAAVPSRASQCAEVVSEIAPEAGVAAAGLQLQSLAARRAELDQHEQQLSSELAQVQAAQESAEGRIAALGALKGELAALVGQLDARHEAEVVRFAAVFQAMPPAAAAARLSLLPDDLSLPIAERMRPRALAAVLAALPPPEARRLTLAIAARGADAARQARAALGEAPEAPGPDAG